MENLGPQAPAVELLPGGGIRLRTDRNWEDTADARKAMYKDATDNYHQLRDLAQTNAQTREMLNVFREASKAFPPGADANVRLQVGRWGAALGLASGDTISRGELMQSVQKSLELNLAQSKMKGQGQITENERKMLEEAISLFKSTGQGGELIMKLYEAKMARDDALLDAHEQSISRNTGVVDPLRVQSKLRGIAGRTFAPALMDEVSTFLKTAKAGSAGGGEPLNAGASRRAPTQAHISRLIQNYQDPQERKFFDEAFGEGAAMRAIEQHNKALRGGVLLVPPGPGNSVSP